MKQHFHRTIATILAATGVLLALLAGSWLLPATPAATARPPLVAAPPILAAAPQRAVATVFHTTEPQPVPVPEPLARS
jgi:hypothetical protein